MSHWEVRLLHTLLCDVQAARCLQRHMRVFLVRQRMLRLHAAAITVQAAARGHAVRAHLLRLRRACLVVADRWLAWKAGQTARLQLQTQQAAALHIQARWRGLQQQRAFRQQVCCITTVQAIVRRHSARQGFLRQRAAAILIQSRWAALQAGRAIRGRAQQRHRAAAHIQAAWRGYRQHGRRLQSAVAVQAAWRGFAARRAYCRILFAVVQIQMAWKVRQARLSLKKSQV